MRHDRLRKAWREQNTRRPYYSRDVENHKIIKFKRPPSQKPRVNHQGAVLWRGGGTRPFSCTRRDRGAEEAQE